MTARRLLIIAALAICLIAGWRLGAQQEPASTEATVSASDAPPHAKRAGSVAASMPPDTSHIRHADRYADLLRAASAGDPDAAYQLARSGEACLTLRQMSAARKFLSTAQPDGAATPEQVQMQEREQAHFDKRLAAAEDGCIGDTRITYGELHELIKRAAELGSPAAQFDYAINPRLNVMAVSNDLDEWRDWRDHTAGYLDAALQSGDARAALILALASDATHCDVDTDAADTGPCAMSALPGMILPKDAETAYRYYLLDRLMNDTARVDWVNGQLQQLAMQLSAAQIAGATAWAEQTYAQIQNAHH